MKHAEMTAGSDCIRNRAAEPAAIRTAGGPPAKDRDQSEGNINIRKPVMIGVQGLAISAIAAAGVLFFTSSTDTLPLLKSRIRWPLVPLLALPIVLSWICNGLRFHLMSRCIGTPLSVRRAVAIAISSEFGIASTPGGLGGTAIRLGFLKKSGISYVQGGSLLAADLFTDLLFFTLVTPFAFTALIRHVNLNALSSSYAPGAAWLFFPLIPALLFLFRKSIRHRIRQHPTSRKYRLAGRLRLLQQKMLKGFRQGRTATSIIFRNHRASLMLNQCLAAVQFTSRYSVLPLSIWLLGIEVNPLPLILVQGVLFMISIAIVVPGGGGSVEGLGAFVLAPFVPASLVGVVILLWRIFTYHFYLFFGGTIFALTFRRLMR
ncbi:MAG: flippase-like domain-containing protein [Pontiellaceae bacterium]|nr:flippase-like domain-containing protein [Pontiellaceae bacterium]MBN2784828.1 flippase-like domain-containing protein [Pontiellaceae bacterium]